MTNSSILSPLNLEVVEPTLGSFFISGIVCNQVTMVVRAEESSGSYGAPGAAKDTEELSTKIEINECT